MMSVRLWLCVTGVMLCLFYGGHGAVASAGTITIYATNRDPWTVSWNDPRVLLLRDTTNRIDGDMTKQTTNLLKLVDSTKDVPNPLGSVVLMFEENNISAVDVGGAAGNPTVRAGPNFVMRNDIINNTGLAWDGFLETLTDRDRKLAVDGGGELIHATVPESTE